MKSIDVKSLLIGFLLCATFFLSVGATSGGKYQIAITKGNGKYIYEAIINTDTGQVTSRSAVNSTQYSEYRGWLNK